MISFCFRVFYTWLLRIWLFYSLPWPQLSLLWHVFSGACRGCTPGYKGHHCELGILFIFTRNCYPHWTALWKDFKLVIYLWTECGDGHFGEGCQSKCGHCADISQCHHEDGTCLNGCKAGYMGAYCKKGKVISFLNTYVPNMECLFPLENVLLIRRIHHYQFKTAYFNHCSTIMIIEQWMFCRMSQQHYYDTGHKIITVISEYPCYSHLSPSVWMWSCHDLF